jgi:hypothetical protein
MITLKDLDNIQEQAQENIIASLDGLPDEILATACQSVIDAFTDFKKEKIFKS